MIRKVLKGERLGPVEDGLVAALSPAHGQVDAARGAMRRLGLEKLIDARQSRDATSAIVAGPMVAPEASKLRMTRAWADTSPGDDLGVADSHEDELCAAMDRLIERQEVIVKRLAKHHLKTGSCIDEHGARVGPRSPVAQGPRV